METASKKAARDVAMVEPDVVVYGCTSGSFFEGPEWNEKICEQLTAITQGADGDDRRRDGRVPASPADTGKSTWSRPTSSSPTSG